MKLLELHGKTIITTYSHVQPGEDEFAVECWERQQLNPGIYEKDYRDDPLPSLIPYAWYTLDLSNPNSRGCVSDYFAKWPRHVTYLGWPEECYYE